MKYIISLLMVFCFYLVPIHSNETAQSIVNKNFLQDPKMKELVPILAGKALSESDKSMQTDELLKIFWSSIQTEENRIKFSSIYEKRFNAQELTELKTILESKTYEKYSEQSYEIGKESLQTVEAILKEILAKQGKTKDQSVPSSTILDLTSKNISEILENTSKPIVLDFYADWCVPCKGIKVSLDNLSLEYKDKIIFGRINIDQEKEITEKFKIKELPALIFIKEGKISGTQKSFATQEELQQKIKEYLL